MAVTIDRSDEQRHIRDAMTWLKTGVQRIMLQHAAQAADVERRTHRYRNRTGLLQTNTMARFLEGGINPTVLLLMGRPYASYVVGRGFSNIDEVALAAAGRITTDLNKGPASA